MSALVVYSLPKDVQIQTGYTPHCEYITNTLPLNLHISDTLLRLTPYKIW